jgi:hypothetical protein
MHMCLAGVLLYLYVRLPGSHELQAGRWALACNSFRAIQEECISGLALSSSRTPPYTSPSFHIDTLISKCHGVLRDFPSIGLVHPFRFSFSQLSAIANETRRSSRAYTHASCKGNCRITGGTWWRRSPRSVPSLFHESGANFHNWCQQVHCKN